MRRNWRRPLTLLAVSVTLLGIALLMRLADHDLADRQQEPFTFTAGNTQLAGTLWRPDTPAQAAVILVHGDGAQDRSSAGGYAPFINTLLDAGIAVAAWDKPGVGGSTGNWLDQSMQDRQIEARAALATLATRADTPVGALGFSQAGWVLPGLNAPEAAFLVLIGPAVSWRDQGAYYTATRLAREGRSAAEITETLGRIAIENEATFGPTAAYDPTTNLTEDRWAFIQRNRDADARADLATLTIPLLAIWGADDLNVDARTDAAIYRATMQTPHPATRIEILPNATHGLLKSGPYNWHLTSDWPWHAQARFTIDGRYAFAHGALDRITDWITTTAAP
ncbi:alpha/beta hydrolase [Cognatishimia sp. MH4019]|uniref:alpha/beta hydrolase n=1 Tax=Cognatishimia sp. MH4019 TaxID=2854030 RepID=UPI001CD50566|nr:alpha/beta fold hydrolase [Cognatishimia sp. MH4019]